MLGIVRIAGCVLIALGLQSALDIGIYQVIAHDTSILIGCGGLGKDSEMPEN
jgi:hypothetical protein